MPMAHRCLLAGIVGLMALVGGARASGPPQNGPVRPVSGARLSGDIRFAPGIYVLQEGLEIVADDTTLDGGGAVLVGPADLPFALRVAGRRSVRIRNLRIHGFYHGLRIEGCKQVRVEDVVVRGTAEVEGPGVFLDIWRRADEAYGAAIFVRDSREVTIRRCDVQHQQNGISFYSCSHCRVLENNASYNSGWGIHLHASSDNEIRGNTADFCNRVYQRGDGSVHVGADAAGLLLVVGSSRNRVVGNRLRGGGDGVFLAGYRHPDIVAPCNDNLFRNNDCSLSPNNAFEATFSTGNRFEGNIANDSNFGFWLGYSARTVVEDNEIRRCRYAGVAIEHGRENRIAGNRLAANRVGVWLWTDEDPGFVERWPEHRDSADSEIVDNEIADGGHGVLIEVRGDLSVPRRVRGHAIRNNRIDRNRVGVQVARAEKCLITRNHIADNAVCGLRLVGPVAALRVFDNLFANERDVVTAGDVRVVWFVEPRAGPNIVGGPRVGGNCWKNRSLTDADGDGFADDRPFVWRAGDTRIEDRWPVVPPERDAQPSESEAPSTSPRNETDGAQNS